MVFFEGEYLALVFKLIQEVKAEILVCVYEWAWYPGQRTGTIQDINRELCRRAKEGVKIFALIHNEPPGRSLGKLNRRSASHLERAGAEVRLGNTGKILHAKLWVFDREKAIVCSHNISERAVTSNAEVGVLIEDEESVKKCQDFFQRLWARASGRVSPA